MIQGVRNYHYKEIQLIQVEQDKQNQNHDDSGHFPKKNCHVPGLNVCGFPVYTSNESASIHFGLRIRSDADRVFGFSGFV